MQPRCPICGGPVDRTAANAHRPFCSSRCQLVDLARWLDEDYTIPGPPAEIPDAPREDPDEG